MDAAPISLNILQYFTAFFIIISIILLLYLYRRNIESTEATLLILLWLVHGVVFYLFLFLNGLDLEFMKQRTWTFTAWSSALRFHTYLTVMCYLIMRILRHRLFYNFIKNGD